MTEEVQKNLIKVLNYCKPGIFGCLKFDFSQRQCQCQCQWFLPDVSSNELKPMNFEIWTNGTDIKNDSNEDQWKLLH